MSSFSVTWSVHVSGMFWAHIPKLSWENNLGFWGCPRTRFQVTLAALTSVACCSFFLRMRLWCSSPRWMRSLSSLSLSSTSQWQSMLSAAFTGFALVPASLGVTLLQNRNGAMLLLATPIQPQPSYPPSVRATQGGAHACTAPSSRREGKAMFPWGSLFCFGKVTPGYGYLFFCVFLVRIVLFLSPGQASSEKSTEYFCSSSSLCLLPFHSSSLSSFSCLFSSFRKRFFCCSSARVIVSGSETQNKKAEQCQLLPKVWSGETGAYSSNTSALITTHKPEPPLLHTLGCLSPGTYSVLANPFL